MNSLSEHFIETTEQLEKFCGRLTGSEWLALDTEFLREKSYYPQFCLLQIANHELAACIDPLRINDLSPLQELLEKKEITKIFHAGHQDLEILYRLWGRIPHPLFDTQLAATLTGLGDQIGYGALVKRLLGKELDKSHVRADWSHRPLEAEQRRYALDDVIYLGKVYLQLRARLEELGRIHWLTGDFDALADPATYETDPMKQWQRIRGRQHLKEVQLAVLQSLAAWRETRAQTRDKPRNWIIKDEVLLELSRRMPRDRQQLERVRGLERGIAERQGDDLLRLIAEARRKPAEQWPRDKAPQPRLSTEQAAQVDILMCALRLRAEAQHLSPQSMATRKELERLVCGERDLTVLAGWRRALVGEDLLEIVNGRLWPQPQNGRIELRKV